MPLCWKFFGTAPTIISPSDHRRSITDISYAKSIFSSKIQDFQENLGSDICLLNSSKVGTNTCHLPSYHSFRVLRKPGRYHRNCSSFGRFEGSIIIKFAQGIQDFSKSSFSRPLSAQTLNASQDGSIRIQRFSKNSIKESGIFSNSAEIPDHVTESLSMRGENSGTLIFLYPFQRLI
jgi:hypothetical protein